VGFVASGTNGKLILNEWTHVAFVRNSLTTAQLYINGVRTDEFTFVNPGTIPVNKLNIGVRERANLDGYFNGSMDEVRIWNRSLCQSEIVNNGDSANGELSLPQQGLLAYYQFNQGYLQANNATENILQDASGNNRTGTLNNFALSGSGSNWSEGIVRGTAPAFTTPTVTVSPNGPTTFCQGGSVTLTASVGDNYLWSTGATSQSIVVSTAGNYSVNVNGCVTSGNTTVNVNALPNISSVIASPAIVCKGDSSIIKVNSTKLTSVGTGTIGNGNTIYPCPMQDYFEGSRAQYLYRASELTGLGLTAGNINGLRYMVTTLNSFTGTIEEYTIKIGTTTASTLGTTTWEPVSTVVYGPVNQVVVVGANTLTFATPFYWNGTDNIVIEICNGAAGNGASGVTTWTGNPTIPFTTGLSFNGSHTYRADNLNNLCNTSNTTNTGTQTTRPNVSFLTDEIQSFSWSQSPANSTLSSTTGRTITATNISDVTTFKVVATSAEGCTKADSVTVSVKLPSTSETSVTACDSYTWNGVTHTASGDFTYKTTNAIGCDSIATLHLAISTGTTIGSITADANPICFNATTTITANGVTGVNPVVSWYTERGGAGSLLGTGNSLSGIKPGKYYAYVTSDCGTAAEDSITIGMTVTGTAIVQNVSCYGGSNGSVTINGTGGTGPYTYKFSQTSAAGYSSNNTFTGLKARVYRMYIMDSQGCEGRTDLITVTQPDAIAATTTATAATCFGAANGSLTVAATGGTGNYTYRLSTRTTTQNIGTFTALNAGDYKVVITDAAGCSFTTNIITVGQPAMLSATHSSTNVTCNGKNNGTVTVTTTGGTAPYKYKLGTSGAYQLSNTFSGLRPTSYRVYVIDSAGCLANTDVITIQQPEKLAHTVNKTDLTCTGGNDGAITVNVTGGTPSYLYKIGSGGAWQSSNTFTGLRATSYRIYYHDQNSCTGYTDVITLTKPGPVTGTASATAVSCFNGSNGTITVTTTSGKAPFKFKLGTSGVWQATNVFSTLKAGTYQVFMQDSAGCTGSISNIVVNQPAQITYSYNPTNASCPGVADGAIHLLASGGTGTLQYRLGSRTPQSTGSFTNLKQVVTGFMLLILQDVVLVRLLSMYTITAKPVHRLM
jgi:hypothetical protein